MTHFPTERAALGAPLSKIVASALTCNLMGFNMAFTPSKDYKGREREQKKAEKRMAREAAKAESKAAARAASPPRAHSSGD